MHTQLLIIDPQNDFCDLPDSHCPQHPITGKSRPSLPVVGAHADMQRLAQWIRREGNKLDAITVTLDSHQRYDIAHPDFWRKGNGSEVAPFTSITTKEVRSGTFVPRDPQMQEHVLHYLNTLEAQGRYTLMVWPIHCEIGSWGHGVHADVLVACGHWQRQRQRAVRNVFKGMNPRTEHYSALQAEVLDLTDPATLPNAALLARLDQAKTLIIAGEASSHCVRATVEHILQLLPGSPPERLVLMQDAMSPVAGFEAAHQEFMDHMRIRGVRLADSDDIRL